MTAEQAGMVEASVGVQGEEGVYQQPPVEGVEAGVVVDGQYAQEQVSSMFGKEAS